MSSTNTPAPLLLEDRAGVAPPRQERSEVSTRRLLEAASELIAEVGYSGTTLATIGARAGYSRSLVTSRFGTKDNLVAVLLEQLTSAWLRYFSTPPPAEDGLQTLLALVRAVGAGVAADRTSFLVLQRLIFEASSPSASRLHGWFHQATRHVQRDVAAIIRTGIADGSIRPDVDPDHEARLVIASLRGISYEWFLYPDLIDMAALHEGLADQLARSLGAPRRPRRARRREATPQPASSSR